MVPVFALALYARFSLDSDSTEPQKSSGSTAAQLHTSLAEIWSGCDGAKETSTLRSPKIPCFLQELPDLSSYEYDEVADALMMLSQQDNGFSRVCHQANHTIAERMYDIDRVYDMILSDEGLCSWSFTHGTLTQFAMVATEEEFLAKIPTVCDNLPTTGHQEACAHGLGHGIVIRSNSSLFDAEAICVLTPEFARRQCVQAVMMSYAEGEASQNEGVSVKLEAPDPSVVDTICTKFSTASLEECWRSFWMLYPKKMPVSEAASRTVSACGLAPAEYKPGCYQGVGESAVWRTREFASRDGLVDVSPDMAFEAGLEACEMVEYGYRSSCARGLGHSYPNIWVEDNGSIVGLPDACARIDSAHREGCFAGMKAFMDNYNLS